MQKEWEWEYDVDRTVADGMDPARLPEKIPGRTLRQSLYGMPGHALQRALNGWTFVCVAVLAALLSVSAFAQTAGDGKPAARPHPGTAEKTQTVRTTDTPPGAEQSTVTLPDWPLTLVNAAHPMPAGYLPPLTDVPGSEKQLERHAAAALQQMFADAKAAGVPLYLVSGYRSVAYQQGLFERKVNSLLAEGLPRDEAERQASGWVARPGTGEHSLGLAADIVSGDWYLSHDDLTQDFEQTPQFDWLRENAAHYGFILRYPAGKEAVTGVHYEPWHYRYVGDAAPRIAALGLTLEEYLG